MHVQSSKELPLDLITNFFIFLKCWLNFNLLLFLTERSENDVWAFYWSVFRIRSATSFEFNVDNNDIHDREILSSLDNAYYITTSF